MKKIILSCVGTIVIGALVGCCDSDRHYRTTDTYESTSVDTKDMQPRHHHHDDVNQ